MKKKKSKNRITPPLPGKVGKGKLMRKGYQGEIDLDVAKIEAENIVLMMIEEGFIPVEKQVESIRYAHAKLADRILAYGDEIRDTCKEAYKTALNAKIEEIEP